MVLEIGVSVFKVVKRFEGEKGDSFKIGEVLREG